ncbi:T9SS type A sorting domain-containing protein [Spirosoma taeanense]|uniref:T9SS type A sorting domain-containing protein n=1 Tax=Spirosoma taeanense TaxID=2735870 RepID=A0A6M5YAW6_9BACT|nr:M43 family zinc metalloprotease [Spirosoma taeanense]QJW90022.1 T9SS type A sorting domain-containing protein [Spirosoma taeanense]
MKKPVNNGQTRFWQTGWRWLAGSFICLLTQAGWAQVSETDVLHRCGTVEYEQHVLQRRNPRRLQQLNELNQLLKQAETDGMKLRLKADDETIYRIPVVVHVIHNTASGAVGGSTNSNISDEQIASQIQVLNEDYRRQPGTNGFNDNPIGADAKIEFFLAQTDPQGQPTTGITRHYYPQKTSFNIFTDDVLLSQIAYWPSDQYLNIWVTTLQDNYLGFTQFPTAADTLSGLPGDTNEFVDGSIIDYRYFGRQIGTVRSPTYGYGRTATHEIGHWLGLLHTWGDGDGCNEDYVADTPPTKTANQTVNCNETFSNCSGKRTRDQIENYLEYSPDLCMNLFTKGQVDRMRAVLTLSPRRARLIRSVTRLPETETLTLTLYPNPTRSGSTVDVQLKGFQSFTVDLIDISGRLIHTRNYTDSPSTSVSLPVSSLTAGLYIVRVKTTNETVSQRLLVQ